MRALNVLALRARQQPAAHAACEARVGRMARRRVEVGERRRLRHPRARPGEHGLILRQSRRWEDAAIRETRRLFWRVGAGSPAFSYGFRLTDSGLGIPLENRSS